MDAREAKVFIEGTAEIEEPKETMLHRDKQEDISMIAITRHSAVETCSGCNFGGNTTNSKYAHPSNDSIVEPHETEDEFGQFKHTEGGIRLITLSDDFYKVQSRQYLDNYILYRERGRRKVSWDELFLDIVYVATFNKLGHLVYVAKLTGLRDFLLSFYPVINAWHLFHSLNNRFGDSFYNRLFLWSNVICTSLMGITVENSFNTNPEQNTGNLFIGVFLLFRLLYFLYVIVAIYHEPDFIFGGLIQLEAAVLLSSIPWFASLFADHSYRYALWGASAILDYGSVFFSVIASYILLGKRKRYAINIEHQTERMGLLTLIVIGEIVVAFVFAKPRFLWTSNSSEPQKPYAVTALGILIAISFQWIYFTIDSNEMLTHAIRRHVITGIAWNMLHTPLHAALVVVGASMYKIVSEYSKDQSSVVDQGHRYFIAFGSASVIALFAVMVLQHESLDQGCRLSLETRIFARSCCVLGLVLVGGLCNELNALELLGSCVALILPLVAFEEFARRNKR